MKTRTHVIENDQAASALSTNEALKIPRSLVVRRGKVESEVIDLVSDLRTLMSPYTALNFQEDTKNTKLSRSMSHYAKELTGPLGLTHILSLSQNAHRLTLRLARTPVGPTLTFKVQRFSLMRHVRATQRRPFDIGGASSNITTRPPIVVTNNFGDVTAAPHVKLMRITFQNMFPAINVATVKLSDCRRVVLFNFIRRDVPTATTTDGNSPPSPKSASDDPAVEEEDEEVEIRHYAIRATPTGVTRRVRRIVQSRIPDLSNLDDISDYITGTTASGRPAPAPSSGYQSSGVMSDSEAEEDTQVVLPQSYSGKGNGRSQKSALKLVELGPRLRLKLVKVERGMASGDVMYHAYVKKDAEEVRERREKVEKEVLGKRKRREEQEENVRRKKAVLEEKREEKRKRREERGRVAMEELRGSAAGDGNGRQDSSKEGSSSEEDGSESEGE